MRFDRERLRFGFEFETLIEPGPKYKRLFSRMKEMGNRGELSSVCGGILNPSGWEGEKIDKSGMSKKEREIIAGLLEANDEYYHRFLITSICNLGPVKGTVFRTMKNTHMVSTPVCDGLAINMADLTISPPPATPAPTAQGERVWMVTHDGSVVQSEFPLYKDFKRFGRRRSGSMGTRTPENMIEWTEIVSPILTYGDITGSYFTDVFRSHLSAYNLLKYWNNDNTSNHVHISYDSPLYQENKHILLIKICMAWWYFEPILLLLMGHWRRRNRYCRAMREKIFFRYPREQHRVFMTMDDTNFLRPDLLGASLRDLPQRTQQDMIHAIVLFFQGDIAVRDTRYAALNLLNMRQRGIQTIEVRIKQGSSDAEENRMFMLMLAEFIASVVERPCVVNQYDDSYKQTAWDMYAMLKNKPTWGTDNRVILSPEEKERADTVFTEFLSYIKNDEVRGHVAGLYKMNCRTTGSSSSEPSVPTVGGAPSQPRSNADSEIEYTPFGMVDYKRMREEAKRDPRYQSIVENMRAATRRGSVTPYAEDTTTTTVAIGGKKKKKDH